MDELKKSIESKDLKLKKQQEELKEAEHVENALRQKVKNTVERMSNLKSRERELKQEKRNLEKALMFCLAEIEILKDSAREERAYLIAWREEEVAEYRKKLEYVKEVDGEKERQEVSSLKKDSQQLLCEFTKKSEDIRHIMNARDETKSQLKMERKRMKMKTKELTAVSVSHAAYIKEVQVSVTTDLDVYVSSHS